ncbi:MAG: cobalt-precorrin-5B (C(1))-methyltransferase CbiD [Kaiparowitsia implicata GSE-PSE-MK54-09C]|nr:cobalt-precorrin-5B (C(1))-methyltransferase CbiD [Kaiparowitsia implicata GSE-PSE-MK54-09C]
MARSGYTLPVFAAAAAKAALLHRLGVVRSPTAVMLDLLPEQTEIAVEQVACLDAHSALAVTRSDPGDNLDLTRDTPIWAWVHVGDRTVCSEENGAPSLEGHHFARALAEPLILQGGEGLGTTATGDPAIYRYAQRLLEANLLPLIPPDKTVTVTIILPEGRQLAQRTSNAAFGVLEGLSLLGTSGISQPLSAADHLEEFRTDLQAKVVTNPDLIFCIGSNGRQVAQRLGLPTTAIVQTGNWLGALLVEAGLRGATSVLLLGYQGKLVKLAGGIFNTSSHLADAKREIISARVIQETQRLDAAQAVLAAPTADAAYQALAALGLATPVFTALAQCVSDQSTRYVQKYAAAALTVGTLLFDRQGEVIGEDAIAPRLIALHTAPSDPT